MESEEIVSPVIQDARYKLELKLLLSLSDDLDDEEKRTPALYQVVCKVIQLYRKYELPEDEDPLTDEVNNLLKEVKDKFNPPKQKKVPKSPKQVQI